jgi:hypothetical protein
MEKHLITLISRLSVIGAVSGVAVSVVGAFAAASSRYFVELTTRRLKKKIVSESERNFRIVTVSHGDIGSMIAAGNGGNRVRTRDAAFKPPAPTPTDLAKKQVRIRLEEVIEERERQESTVRWSQIASRTLTFGQYIIGAMLTTSLVQNSLSKTWISIFGLLVILCSATKQHFHVDENAQASDARAKRLRALVRYAQDQIAILEIRSTMGEDRSDAFVELLNDMTKSLNQIESVDMSFIPMNSEPKEPEDKAQSN